MSVDQFENDRGVGKSIIGTHSVDRLCTSLALPRRVKIMVNAGAAVDRVTESYVPQRRGRHASAQAFGSI
jgi:6-phosphogluconate dehydrogenase